MSDFKIRLILSSAIILLFVGCNEEASNEKLVDVDAPTIESYPNAQLAQITQETVSTILGSSYELNGTATSSNIEYRSEAYNLNPYSYEHDQSIKNGNQGGTKTYTFKTNTSTKTYTQTHDYDYWVDKDYDEVCDKYNNNEWNGLAECKGDYTHEENGKFYLEDKLCEYRGSYTSGDNTYKSGGERYYNYKSHLRKRDYEYTSNGKKYAKIGYDYYYKEDVHTKTYLKYYNDGRYYFDNLSKYIKIDTTIDQSAHPIEKDLCNGSYYSGIEYWVGKDNVKLRLSVVLTNTIRAEKSTDGITWELIGVYTK